MARPLWLKVMVLMCLLSVSAGRELKIRHEEDSHIYNSTLAKILVEYCSAVYMTDLTALFTWTCSRCNDMIEGFEMVELIVDVQNCLQAFVGVDHNLNSIIVAFRGTQENSLINWVEDLFWKELDLNYPGMSGATVHHGWYSAYHNTTLRPAIVDAVKETKKVYGDLHIIVTGHSMGAALAAFCAIDLRVNYGMKNLQLMTFGQPRIGNSVFASFFSERVPHTIRVTHEHDIVPHLPPYFYYFPHKTYHHFPREVWIHTVGIGSLAYMVEQVCDGSGEDPTCSRSVSGNSVSDHRYYYDILLESDTWSDCGIVMLNSSLRYQKDHAGNIVLSKDITASSILHPRESAESGSSSI